MDITVAVISQSVEQRQHVARAIGEMPDLFVVYQADDLKALRDLPAIPQVVIIGVPHLTPYRNIGTEKWYFYVK